MIASLTWASVVHWLSTAGAGKVAAVSVLVAAVLWLAWRAHQDAEDAASDRSWWRQYRRENPPGRLRRSGWSKGDGDK